MVIGVWWWVALGCTGLGMLQVGCADVVGADFGDYRVGAGGRGALAHAGSGGQAAETGGESGTGGLGPGGSGGQTGKGGVGGSGGQTGNGGVGGSGGQTDTGGVGGSGGGNGIVCVPGARRCNGLTPQACDGTRTWVDGAPCADVCSAGACTGVCVPGTTQCNGLTPQTCDANGAWVDGAPCTNVCNGGVCAGACTPGTTQCSGNGVQTCSLLAQWDAVVPCTGATPGCRSGQCTAPSSYLGSSFASLTGTTSFSLPLPSGATGTSTLYVLVVFENNVASRPAIPMFSIVASANVAGSAANGPTSTWVLYKGQSSTAVTIPNDPTLGGAQASCAAFSGSTAESGVVAYGVATVSKADTFSKSSTEVALALGGYDMGTADQLSSATLSGFTSTATYLFADGAVVGRGGFVGIEDSANTSVSAVYPAAPVLGYFVVRMLVD